MKLNVPDTKQKTIIKKKQDMKESKKEKERKEKEKKELEEEKEWNELLRKLYNMRELEILAGESYMRLGY